MFVIYNQVFFSMSKEERDSEIAALKEAIIEIKDQKNKEV